MIVTFLLLLGRGILLGLGAAAPIGPVNVEIARRTLRFGRRAGWAVGLGAATIDGLYAVVTSVAAVPIQGYPKARLTIGILGALFLGYLALQCFRGGIAARKAPPADLDAPPPRISHHTHYLTGLLMTSLNPMTLLFWFVAFPGTVLQFARSGSDLPIVAAGVFVGALGWAISFACLIGYLGGFGKRRWLAWVDFAGGAMLLAFAVQTIWKLSTATL